MKLNTIHHCHAIFRDFRANQIALITIDDSINNRYNIITLPYSESNGPVKCPMTLGSFTR